MTGSRGESLAGSIGHVKNSVSDSFVWVGLVFLFSCGHATPILDDVFIRSHDKSKGFWFVLPCSLFSCGHATPMLDDVFILGHDKRICCVGVWFVFPCGCLCLMFIFRVYLDYESVECVMFGVFVLRVLVCALVFGRVVCSSPGHPVQPVGWVV